MSPGRALLPAEASRPAERFGDPNGYLALVPRPATRGPGSGATIAAPAAPAEVQALLPRDPSLTMEPRRVPVDWEELELALEMRSDERESYLDVRAGEVRMSRIDPFGGEPADHELTDEEGEADLADGTPIAVEPLESSVEYAWMADFADAVPDARVRWSFQQAVGGGRPFRRFKDTRAAHPRERERWFAFREERLRDAIREWLADNDIEPTIAPPRRSGDAAPGGAR